MNALTSSMEREAAASQSDSRGLARFLAVSFLLVATPLTITFWMSFATGDRSEAFLILPRWLSLAVLYWWPVGAFLSWRRGRGRTWVRLLLGYLISVPLYFIALAVVYPAFGAAFHPWANRLWGIYLSATPQFYGMVLLVSYLTSRRIAEWVVRGALLVFAGSALFPVLLLRGNSPQWPRAFPHEVAIEGARIVDAGSNRIIEGRSIYIRDGRITEIGASSSHPGWTRISAGGLYLMPGLIDVHTHLQSPVEVRAGFRFGYFMRSVISSYGPERRAYLESGVTTIRDVGGPAKEAFQMRGEIERKEMLGPRLLAVGRLVTSPRGHPVSTIWTSSISKAGAILAKDEKTMIEGLERNLAAGPPDAVKFIHGTIGRAKEELSPDLMARGIQWARDHGLASIVHTETEAEFEDAVRAGATGVEHAAYLESLSPSTLALVAERRPFVDPTFGEYETDLMLRKVPKTERDNILRQRYRVVEELFRSGARIVIGTDAPMVAYGSGLHDEIAHFVRVGFEPWQILTMATTTNAQYLGREKELGRVAPGLRADLVLVKENPLRNPETLRTPVWTMLDGQIVAWGDRSKK